MHLQVLSTSPALLSCRSNCLDVLNAAVQKTESHPTNALLEDKLVFLRVDAKENVYIPGADEHIFVCLFCVFDCLFSFVLSNIRNILSDNILLSCKLI